MRRPLLCLFFVLLVGCLPTGSLRRVYRSPDFHLQSRKILPENALELGTTLQPLENQPGELLWLTGFSLSLKNKDDGRPTPQLLGFSSVDFRWPDWHRDKFSTTQDHRLFGAGQGSTSFHLPSGFGIPLSSNEGLVLSSRVFNLDAYLPEKKVYQEIILDFVRERGLSHPFHPILVRNVAAGLGQNTFWEVPPGGMILRNKISPNLKLSGAATLHGLTAHLERYAVSVELYDATLRKSLLKLTTQSDSNGLLQTIESYSSNRGLQLHPDHEYEAVVQYANPTKAPVRGVCYLTFYFYDGNFKKPPR